MAGRKENLKSLFTNSRTRVILLLTGFVLLFVVVLGVYKFTGTTTGTVNQSGARLVGTPGGLDTTPGQQNVSQERLLLTEKLNMRNLEAAQKSGQSAIPIIAQLTPIGDAGQGLNGDRRGLGFSGLTREEDMGAQRSLWLQDLKNGNCSKEVVQKVLGEGATFDIVKQACTCAQLKDDGYDIATLKQICSCTELRKSGFTARQFKSAGYDATQLRQCGFDACQLRNAGFTAQQLKDAGFTDGELKGAGYPANEIAQTSGLPAGITENEVRNAGCNPEALQKLRTAGVSATYIKETLGCSAAVMKAAGYTAAQLKAAGYTAGQLKAAGFTAGQLRDAGFTAHQLKDAGFTDGELKAAGYPADEIEQASGLPAGITEDDVRKAGCSPEALQKLRKEGVSASAIIRASACTPAQLQAGGFTPQEIGLADCSVASLTKARESGVSATSIKESLGCSATAMKAAGFTAAQLKAAGYTAGQLKAAGYTAGQLKDAGFTAAELKDAGYTAGQLKDAGFTAEQLKAAGYSAAELKAAGYTAGQLKDAGFTAAQLKDAGYTAAELKAAGFTAAQLKDAGYTAAQLNAAGYTAAQLRDAGYTAAQLRGAGYTAAQLRAAGYSPDELSAAGFPVGPGTALDTLAGPPGSALGTTTQPADTQQLQQIMKQQQQQAADQQFQQQIQDKSSAMYSAANAALQGWQQVSIQQYMAGDEVDKQLAGSELAAHSHGDEYDSTHTHIGGTAGAKPYIQTGDILFAVMDTSVNSDQQGPVLATVVSGQFKGAKLIGGFSGPGADSDKLTLSFNTMTIPNGSGSIGISALAIDQNTARTGLSSRVNNHYFSRYGALFAATFLEGFGNAFQSANTTVTIGGTGGGDNITIAQGVNRSALENAVIGLATLGQSWGQVAQQKVNRPPTVEIFSGTPIGVLFTRDLTSLHK